MRLKAPISLGLPRREILVRTATALFNEQCAIAILANLPERLNSHERKDQVDALAQHTSGQLKQLISALREAIARMRVQFGVKLEQDELLAVLDQIQQTTRPDHACYVPVWKLSEWLSKYEALGLDAHCRISIDPHCIGRDYPGGFEIRVLEITMFEDVASLFNLARQAHMQTAAKHGVESRPQTRSRSLSEHRVCHILFC